MVDRTARKRYVRPTLRKGRRLSDVTEGGNVFVTGGSVTPKGGCFSNRR
jgi:hypothetical protein